MFLCYNSPQVSSQHGFQETVIVCTSFLCHFIRQRSRWSFPIKFFVLNYSLSSYPKIKLSTWSIDLPVFTYSPRWGLIFFFSEKHFPFRSIFLHFKISVSPYLPLVTMSNVHLYMEPTSAPGNSHRASRRSCNTVLVAISDAPKLTFC